MTDNVSKQRRSEIMKAVRSRNTSPEIRVRRELWKRGIRFRVNVKDLPGKPDIAVKKLKVAIFIDSCFWHGCVEHGRIPKSNVAFWTTKIDRNKERDRRVTEQYIANGWCVVRIWEHDLNEHFEDVIDHLVTTIQKAKRNSG
ncbi:very short patch repair endonuclease [Alicyclobacillus sp. TC]|uniref:very short patch repair endonuclease n=1 Tax=Alicyclobacillus sp. TC TaxID=2606450 RepID=UPI001932A56D|nr:very short patch repair endonuclease [Alicyclobacillus sp. TC]QRF22267.1 very short patch repair endonuclease [Alicyclobacillus sp. TC]